MMELFLPLLKDGGPWIFTLAILGWMVWFTSQQNSAARAEFLAAFKEKRADDQAAVERERTDYLAALKSQAESHQQIMHGVTEQMKSISSDMKATNQVLANLVARVERLEK